MSLRTKTGGRGVGTPNRRTSAFRRQLQDQADPIGFLTRVMNGDVIDGLTPTMAERLTAARDLRRVIVPDAKELPVTIQLPPVTGPKDLSAGMSVVISSVAGGQITLGEGKAVADLLEGARKTYETTELAERIATLEKKA